MAENEQKQSLTLLFKMNLNHQSPDPHPAQFSPCYINITLLTQTGPFILSACNQLLNEILFITDYFTTAKIITSLKPSFAVYGWQPFFCLEPRPSK